MKFIFKNKFKILFVSVLLVGGLFRFVGTNPGYNPYHADETMSYSSAWQMYLNHNLDPQRYDYPSLVPIINLIFYIVLFVPFYKIFFPSFVFGANDLHAMFWSRYITAFISTLMLILIYKTTYRLFKSKVAAIISMIILAVNFRIVMNSHFGLPDVYNAFFLLLSFYLTVGLLKKSSIKRYLVAGVALGLSFSIKFQIYAFIPFLMAFLYKEEFKKSWFTKIFVAGLAASIIILLLNPYHFINFEKFYDVNYYTYLRYVKLSGWLTTLYGLLYLYRVALTPLMAIAVLFGLLMSLRKNFFVTVLLLSVLVPFLYTFLYRLGGGALYVRNFITVLPIMIIFAAVFFDYLYQLFSKALKFKSLNLLVLAIVLLFALSESISDSWMNAKYNTQPWGIVKMRDQINKIEIPNISKVASHPWDFGLILSQGNLERLPLELDSMYSVAELRSEDANYALLGLDVVDVANSWWMGKTNFDFWNKRIDIFKNQFPALAVNELTLNTVASAVKPWQAPDNNYVFVKIPDIPEVSFEKKQEYSFDNQNQADLWLRIDDQENTNLVFDSSTGYLSDGSLKLGLFHPKYRIARFVSPSIKVIPGKLYKVSGWIKSQSEVALNSRDGFLRVDFYSEVPKIFNEFSIGEGTALSERYYGNDWKRVELNAIAPLNTEYMTISFQVGSAEVTSYWIDDIVVEESAEELSINNKGAHKYKVPEEVLFPYSQGGL